MSAADQPPLQLHEFSFFSENENVGQVKAVSAKSGVCTGFCHRQSSQHTEHLGETGGRLPI